MDVYPPGGRAPHAVLPTKTSQRYIQFAGISISFLNAGSHVLSISCMNLLVLMIFVAVTLSMVSLLLIARYHLALISPSVGSFSCITLSHLRTQITYADSDRRIWKSRVGPWCVVFRCLRWLCLLIHSGRRVMLPHPSIIPSVISGQGMFRCGHRFFASDQMNCVLLSLQCIRMWLIVSVSLQVEHVFLSSYPLMFPQYFPTRWVPWIDLYRNC